MSKKNPVLIIAGPTGSGKTALALDLAAAFSGNVINADSMQVYEDLRILTARPSADEEVAVPHKLFGVMPASSPCSVGRWLEMAVAEIEAAWGQDRLPILAGGTGMYLKALTDGLAFIPEIPDGILADVRDLYDQLGGEGFKDALAKLDPDGAAKLPPGDRQRLERLMAVAKATGKPLTHWQAQQTPGPAVDACFATIALIPAREDLYAATDRRFGVMMTGGALDEVRSLLAQNLDPALPAMKALGVPELGRHLAGLLTLDEAVAAARQATRNFAKRQLTWLRNQVRADYVIEGSRDPDHQDGVKGFVEEFLL